MDMLGREGLRLQSDVNSSPNVSCFLGGAGDQTAGSVAEALKTRRSPTPAAPATRALIPLQGLRRSSWPWGVEASEFDDPKHLAGRLCMC